MEADSDSPFPLPMTVIQVMISNSSRNNKLGKIKSMLPFDEIADDLGMTRKNLKPKLRRKPSSPQKVK